MRSVIRLQLDLASHSFSRVCPRKGRGRISTPSTLQSLLRLLGSTGQERAHENPIVGALGSRLRVLAPEVVAPLQLSTTAHPYCLSWKFPKDPISSRTVLQSELPFHPCSFPRWHSCDSNPVTGPKVFNVSGLWLLSLYPLLPCLSCQAHWPSCSFLHLRKKYTLAPGPLHCPLWNIPPFGEGSGLLLHVPHRSTTSSHY